MTGQGDRTKNKTMIDNLRRKCGSTLPVMSCLRFLMFQNPSYLVLSVFLLLGPALEVAKTGLPQYNFFSFFEVDKWGMDAGDI